jgi:hypothetical protein
MEKQKIPLPEYLVIRIRSLINILNLYLANERFGKKYESTSPIYQRIVSLALPKIEQKLPLAERLLNQRAENIY